MGSNPMEAIMRKMMENPPDPNGPVPLSNRPETIYGITIPFHVLSWAAVIFRLHTRLRIVREPGWDDLFVVLAAIFNLMAMIAFFGGVEHGIGKHLLLIPISTLNTTFKWMYVQSASYTTCAFLIKVSLLCQYLRIFRTGALRMFCITLLVIVILWGVAFTFMTWVPCFPVSGFWDRERQPPAKCYGFGWGDISSAMVAFMTFAATNMVLDTIIFLVPLVKYFKPGLGRREYFALTALFALGSIVVLMAVLRLWTAAKRSPDDINSMDFTWWYPVTLILACLEVDFAIMACSMPIFWPVILSQVQRIFVTQEVHITHHQRLDDCGYEMGRSQSVKSMGSQEGLTREGSLGMPKTNYNDPFIVDHVTGKMPTNSEVEISGRLKK